MTTPSIVQACTRCGAYWPVAMSEWGLVPARWCPRCQGNLSRPFQPPGQVRPGQAHPAQPPQPAGPPGRSPEVPQQTRAVVTGTAAGRMRDPHAGAPGTDRSPADTRRIALPRGYRWIARPPASNGSGREDRVGPARQGDLGPTPRYLRTPEWGLPIGGPEEVGDTASEKAAAQARRTRSLLTATMVAFGLAAIAEAFRYGLLLRNRGHLVHALTVSISDATAIVFGYVAMACVVASAVSCARWLMAARVDAFGAVSAREHRRRRWMYAGVLVPIVNLVYPGVYLTELVQARRRAGTAGGAGDASAYEPGLDDRSRCGARGDGNRAVRAASDGAAALRWGLRRARDRYRRLRDGSTLLSLTRFWWGLWVLTNVTAVAVVLARWDGGMQARADNVLYTVYANLLALAAVAVTRILVDRVEGRVLQAHEEPAFWVLDTGRAADSAAVGTRR